MSGKKKTTKNQVPAETTKQSPKAGKRKKAQANPTPEPVQAAQAPAEQPEDASTGEQPSAAKPEKLSALDAAAKVLAEKGVAMNTKEMIGVMAVQGYWSSPGGKTPHATLYSAILREMTVKGEQARFRKAARGKFTLAPTA